MRRSLILLVVLSVAASVAAWSLPERPAASAVGPVATSAVEYQALGRIFPDPHGCQKGQPGHSPYAKGLACAADFLQFSEFEAGIHFLEETFPRFVKIFVLHEDFDCDGKPVKDDSQGCAAFRSAGLPNTLPDGQGTGFSRDRRPLYLVRVSDEAQPIKPKKHFVFPLGIHGIERAGVEGGTRAAEDLATWAACESKTAPDYVDCSSSDNEAPHPLLEATPKTSVTAGDALRRSAVFFMYPNPDGWIRGDRTEGAQFYQRYNGNGVDLNRDWPQEGFTFRPYTPWSEPESRGFGRVLQQVGPKDGKGNPAWSGGIDLHGQLVDRAFSFTLIGNAQRPYDKNQRVLQVVKGAWRDAEARLAWSPVIKPNDAPQDDPRLYGVQWGTVWDTIDYTVTGALGDWIDSPIGLNADGIDNEMSLSHLSNCGIGTCFERDAEQLHVDGNKSLIYSMINYSLKGENTKFRTKGRVAYVHNRGAVKEKADPLVAPPQFTKLPPQNDIPQTRVTTNEDFILPFNVKGRDDGKYNGGIVATITCANLQGVSNCALSEALLERKASKAHHDHAEGDWETVNSYYNQSAIYVQAGQALHANLPSPGKWRVRIDGANDTDLFDISVDFTKEKGWPDPGQVGYRATNMQFWRDLKPFARPGLSKLTAAKIENTSRWKRRFDTIVVTNKVYGGVARELRQFARRGGNVVLLDKSLKMLQAMRIVEKGSVASQNFYAGYVNFATAKKEETYGDPLAHKINQRGAAEGQSGGEDKRRQTYEPVPLNFAIQTPDDDDAFNSPVWFVRADAFRKAKGRQRAVATTGETSQISLGEIKLGRGRIRFLGGVLPMPSKKSDNPFGVSDYATTYSGYQLIKNLLTW